MDRCQCRRTAIPPPSCTGRPPESSQTRPLGPLRTGRHSPRCCPPSGSSGRAGFRDKDAGIGEPEPLMAFAGIRIRGLRHICPAVHAGDGPHIGACKDAAGGNGQRRLCCRVGPGLGDLQMALPLIWDQNICLKGIPFKAIIPLPQSRKEGAVINGVRTRNRGCQPDSLISKRAADQINALPTLDGSGTVPGTQR